MAGNKEMMQWMGWASSIVAILLGLWAIYPSWFSFGGTALPLVLGGLNILFGLVWIGWMLKGMKM